MSLPSYPAYRLQKRHSANAPSTDSLLCSLDAKTLDESLTLASRICLTAGEKLLSLYEPDIVLRPELKQDDTPVTAADRLVDEFIIGELSRHSSLPIVTEETQLSWEERRNLSSFWLLDPLDGTYNFLRRDNEFSILLALIDNHRPVLGVICVPVNEIIYEARLGGGVYRRQNGERQRIAHPKPERPCQIVVSKLPSRRGKSLTDDFCRRNGISPSSVTRVGSGYKFGQMAEGKFDASLRFDRLGEWDIAAADCILSEAGCNLMDVLSNQPFSYNSRETLMLSGYLACREDFEFVTE